MTKQGTLLRLFFLSGASGLLYQVLWIRIFTSILGGTTQSMSAVVSAFMLGMAAGSYIFGRIADRTPRAVRLCGLLELAAGAAAALAFVLFIATSAFGEALYGVVPYRVYQWLLFGVAFIFVLVPAVFLGGMLPPLIRQLTTTEESLRPVLSSLYAANSLGAAFGAMGPVSQPCCTASVAAASGTSWYENYVTTDGGRPPLMLAISRWSRIQVPREDCASAESFATPARRACGTPTTSAEPSTSCVSPTSNAAPTGSRCSGARRTSSSYAFRPQ